MIAFRYVYRFIFAIRPQAPNAAESLSIPDPGRPIMTAILQTALRLSLPSGSSFRRVLRSALRIRFLKSRPAQGVRSSFRSAVFIVSGLAVQPTVECAEISEYFFSAASRGYVSAEIPAFDIYDLNLGLYRYGTFFSDGAVSLGIDSVNRIQTGVKLSAGKYRSHHSSGMWYAPYFNIRVGKGTVEDRDAWSVAAGKIPRTTLGTGLTLKDFHGFGGGLAARIGQNTIAGNYWGTGYTNENKFAFLGYSRNTGVSRGGVNALLMLEKHGDPRVYLLPCLWIGDSRLHVYAEYGYKQAWNSYDGFERSSELGDQTHAVNVGFGYTDTLWGFPLRVNPELRYYMKNFIPESNVDKDYLTDAEHEYSTTNNWVDFFDSNDNSFWYYHLIEIETPRLWNFAIFGVNELLWFESAQNTITVNHPEYTIFQYRPSTNYYTCGLRYYLDDFAVMRLAVTNRMLNENPEFRIVSTNSQYKTRFVPSEKPVIELNIHWTINR